MAQGGLGREQHRGAADETRRGLRIVVGVGFGALVAVVALVLVVSVSSQSRLDVLRDDPLASYVPTTPGSAVVREVASGGDSIMKPAPAVLHRRFSIPPGAEQELMDELAAVADAEGWDVDARDWAGGYVGHTDAGGADLRVTIGVAEEDDEVYLDLSTRG